MKNSIKNVSVGSSVERETHYIFPVNRMEIVSSAVHIVALKIRITARHASTRDATAGSDIASVGHFEGYLE